jgi:threonine synthase
MARETDKMAVAQRPPTMWRYRELLPVGNPASIVTLGEGFTPLLHVGSLGKRCGLPHLWLKDEGLNPTGTFKARGASCGVSRAKELGIARVTLPTAGNAGAAYACYGAAAGVKVHVAMPEDASSINILECRAFGAELTLVKGLISDAAQACAKRHQDGWFDAATLHEPYRVEGKKTLGFEVAEQMGWHMPDAIIYPAGGGVGIIGIWRGLCQLRELGWVEGDLPRLIITQPEGCAPLVKAFEEGRASSEPWSHPETIADGLRVPHALGDFLVLQAIRETGGNAIAVSDELILEAVRTLADLTGVLASPEGAATLAAAVRLRERGDLREDETVVLINTGSGLLYPEALSLSGRKEGA